MRTLAAALLIALGGPAAPVAAGVLHVPADYPTIQAALDAALDGDEIVVAAGVYPESIEFPGLAVTLRSADGPALTTIDAGGLGGSAVRITRSEASGSVLRGFTVTGGSAAAGGGIVVINAGPAVIDCIIAANGAGEGGGAYVSSGFPTFRDCAFIDNAADFGGGAVRIVSLSDVVFSGCTFEANGAPIGGSVFASVGSAVAAMSCTFVAGSALGGGAMFLHDTDVLAADCLFAGNGASQTGGALALGEGGQSEVLACVFAGNSAGFAGGAAVSGAAVLVANCLFSGNEAALGGGWYSGGATTLANCAFSANSGSGLVSDSTDSPLVDNCILWGNSPAQIANDPAFPTVLAVVRFSDVQGGWSGPGGNNIDADPLFADADGADGVPGTADDDARLLPGSPCIDAADNAAVPGCTFDLDANERFADDPASPDRGSGDPPVVDMGPYEFASVPAGRDCNGNSLDDGCEVDLGLDPDCNGNGIPDECDVFDGTSPDCNADGVPDECDPDCNGNGAPDGCDVDDGTSPDCNGNGAPDECDVDDGTSPDCNANGAPDECDVDDGTSPDCNGNGVPDECDVGGGTSPDCNGNGAPDECDVDDGTSADCNANGVPDECDLLDGTLHDENGNGFPDECKALCGDGSLTHSASFEIVPGNSTACSPDGGQTTAANAFARSYDLAALLPDLGFAVRCVFWGIEANTAMVPVTASVNLYADTSGGTPEGDAPGLGLALLGSAPLAITAGGAPTTFVATFDPPLFVLPGVVLVVELELPDLSGITAILPGSNPAGQSGGSYIRAASCGLPAYADLADFPGMGAPDMHLVNRVAGTALSDCAGDCAAPPDFDVGMQDLLALLAAWGELGLCDLDGKGVGESDLMALLSNWGPCR